MGESAVRRPPDQTAAHQQTDRRQPAAGNPDGYQLPFPLQRSDQGSSEQKYSHYCQECTSHAKKDALWRECGTTDIAVQQTRQYNQGGHQEPGADS